jgi:HAD domain in Swiss Army Knife RNA repair proteins
MSQEKLLFLDFDGVLHPTHFAGESPFSKAHLLEETLAQFAPKIVISSSWRFTHSLNKLQKILPTSIGQLIIGATSVAMTGKYPRFQEIQNYLSSYGPADWRALDDSYWEFPTGCTELIRCDPNTGLTIREITKLKNWLA